MVMIGGGLHIDPLTDIRKPCEIRDLCNRGWYLHCLAI